MPVVNLTNKFLKSINSTGAIVEYRDETITGFLVRVKPTGHKSYVLQYGRGKRFLIGGVGTITLDQAKEIARDKLALVRQGHDLNADKREAVKKELAERNRHTYKTYIEKDYAEWVAKERKSAADTLQRLRIFYPDFGHKLLEEISAGDVQKWATKRTKEGIKVATNNRLIAAIKAALSKAVEWDIITENPLAKLRVSGGADGGKVVRFLLPDEEIALRDALDSREERFRAERESVNAWRRQRRYEEKPKLPEFADYLKPMVLISLNTGIRQGELLSLVWSATDLDRGILTIHGDLAKSGKTRHIPLNREALSVLQHWKNQANSDEGLVFPSRTGGQMDNVQKSWTAVLTMAGIKDFRWHDLRHTFASTLVMAGTNLNTVRELMGHADIKMTLRYAHLGAEHKQAAVDSLTAPIRAKVLPFIKKA